MWRQIELYGPVEDGAEALDLPPGIDASEWAERAATQADRRRTFIAFYSWGVPSREAIAAIAAFVGGRRLLEVCAGSGLWARLLSESGVGVIATDGWPDCDTHHFPVESNEAEAAVRAHPECQALLLCWPPFRDDCAYRALRAFTGDLVAYVGDVRFTADQQLHDLLDQEWMLCERILTPAWPGLDDYAFLYSRKESIHRG